jgi:hypothetical protein
MEVEIPQDVTFQEGNQGAENLRRLVEVELGLLNSNPKTDRAPVPIVLGRFRRFNDVKPPTRRLRA